jgi:hypothetical protein
MTRYIDKLVGKPELRLGNGAIWNFGVESDILAWTGLQLRTLAFQQHLVITVALDVCETRIYCMFWIISESDVYSENNTIKQARRSCQTNTYSSASHAAITTRYVKSPK